MDGVLVRRAGHAASAFGKRLCYESEWVTACEGPAKTPFPYGYSRDNSKCNIDNTWIKPQPRRAVRQDPAMRDKELSGSIRACARGRLPECVSGFGVHDMTGNFDEWVTADRRHDDKSEWAALKGGAWGHVRNACRPIDHQSPAGLHLLLHRVSLLQRCAGRRTLRPEEQATRAIPAVEPANRAPCPNPAYPAGPSPTKVGPTGGKWPKPAG